MDQNISSRQSPPDYMAEAVRNLERRLAEVEAEAEMIRGLLDGARGRRAGAQSYSPTTRPGQYAGYKISRALELYLRERIGQKVSIQQVAKDLLVGGFVAQKMPGWKSKTPNTPEEIVIRNIKITLNAKRGRTLFESEPSGSLKDIAPENILVWISEDSFAAPMSKKKPARA